MKTRLLVVIALSSALAAGTHQFKPRAYSREFSPYMEPALRIRSGDTVSTTCVDSEGMDENGKRVTPPWNPLTGPFYVEGAESGDSLEVELRKVRLNRKTGFGSSRVSEAAVPPQYVMKNRGPYRGTNWIFDLETMTGCTDLTPRLAGYRVPLRPFPGCIGTAPAWREAQSSITADAHGGNVDYNRLVEGTKTFLPVNVAGAFFFLGDGHAAQGDGETSGGAIETTLAVEFRVTLHKKKTIPSMRAESDEFLMALGMGRPLEDALQKATANMLDWLRSDYGLTPEEAHVLIGTAARFDVASVPNPRFTMACRIEKKLVERAGGARRVEAPVCAPQPARPIAYYADFGDDLINIFGAGAGAGAGKDVFHHELRLEDAGGRNRSTPNRTPDGRLLFSRAGFDDYFRRLQCQGVRRLIVWLSPYPFVTGASVYDEQDQARYDQQARAIIESRELTEAIARRSGHVEWAWLRDMMSLRADPQAQKDFAESARAHAVKLAVSYRPFEPAASKYYEIPVFAADGQFLWTFFPLASPAVNSRAREIGFANYREVLARMGREKEADVESILLDDVRDVDAFLARFRIHGDNLRVVASDWPPLQSDSLVPVREADGSFRLRAFAEIQTRAEARRYVAKGFTVRRENGGGLRIAGLRIPRGYRYILLENPSTEAPLKLLSRAPARLVARAGNALGRTNVYWSFDESTPERKKTRVAGITRDAGYHTVFFASEAGAEYLKSAGTHVPLDRSTLVVDRGDAYSAETMDFNLPAMRELAVAELRAILAHPAFDEIYVNTRSHTQLAGDMADGVDGIKTKADYAIAKRPGRHLGVDLGYAPRGVSEDAALRRVSAASLTTFQHGEWEGGCQSADCAWPWRYARNTHIAHGVRALLDNLVVAFPGTRIRVVLPERQNVADAVASLRKTMPPATVSYTGSRNNYMPSIGEGMTMLDLTGLKVEPVLLGVGPFVDAKLLDAYLEHALADLKTNRGSSFRGPRAIMYEGQWTLGRANGEQERLSRISQMLSREGIGEGVLYEAADWIFRLGVDQPWKTLDAPRPR
jgi:amidase